MAAVSRRALLLGGAGIAASAFATGGVLVNEGVLPGRVRAYDLLGLNGESAPIPQIAPGRRYDGSFDSVARKGVRTGWSLSVPPGYQPEGLPLLVCLHGARADHHAAFDALGIDRFLAQAVADGVPPFAVAAVDGGAESYWHKRSDGTDSGAMIFGELVPILRGRFSLSEATALYGWSMGGYGALRLALLGAPISAVAACSPALFASYEDAAVGAFDSSEDFDREGLRGRAKDFPDLPVRIDCGNGDPFYFPVRDFIEDLPRLTQGGFEDGAHTVGYMRRMLPDQLEFLGNALV
ncbi:MAG: alpha/beta hydrolase-fold protein [Propionibacteriales bacterium]|nr:alpha/beta hydrolase-fold protein [Propionibacteriales bacterium]